MQKRCGVAVAVVLTSLLGASSASAATEVGDGCVANEAEGAYTLVPLQRASTSSLPLAAPVGGVVTSWKVNSARPEPVTERMRVLRPTGVSNEFQVVGESGEGIVNQGANTFPTRIPVQPGDRFGAIGSLIDVALCVTSDPGDQVGFFLGGAPVGSTHTFTPASEVRLPMSAVIEPDIDGDGYGDETQDRCPQSPAYHDACPRVQMNAVPIVGKRSVTLLVTSNIPTSASVSEAMHRAGRNVGAARYPGLRTPLMPVTPGTIVPFKLYFYRGMIATLKSLSPKRSMTLRLTVTALNLTGPPTTEGLAVKIKGQKKPARKR